ncbi:heavy metal-associated isoprenylated plant protein 33-like [Diaphorina citri]|uniref:Heavy metal-associated isoprenylated plant protein 33-like n=1 Tax=Diaphorina citri TaxID=121845 RepID=A0A3Q0J1A7_DIACI|nr:heavy metal-associated isoprenylated plant protein 33-like [Diaphorina citri]
MSNGFPRYNPSGGSGPRKSNDFPPLPPDTDQSLNDNKGDSMFDRNRDNNRFKRKYEDRDDSKGPRGRKSDSISTGSKYSGNRYEQEEVQQKQNVGNALFGNNSTMGNMNKGHGNMNMGPGNMGGGNMSDGMMQPPLPPMPPPQNSMMMGNMMGNNMGMGGNMGSNMGMGGNMGMGNMGGMGMNPMMGGGPNPMMNMGMNMMGQFPMMPPMPGPDGNMGGMMGPGVPQLMNTDFMNVFSKINTREPIPFSDFILYPPSPNAPPPTTRDRPLGCKTIFVGGLPENFKVGSEWATGPSTIIKSSTRTTDTNI